MLFFIPLPAIETQNGFNLNTSHVILYQDLRKDKNPVFRHLNTSHVILYHMTQLLGKVRKVFKYISCYSLSCPAFDKAVT